MTSDNSTPGIKLSGKHLVGFDTAYRLERIGGRYGHLSNDTAAQILKACVHGGLRHVMAAHLSRENNRPELALEALATAAGADARDIRAAGPEWGFDWIELR